MTPDNAGAANDYRRRATFYELEYQDTYDLPFWQRFAEGARTVLEVPCGHGARALALAAPDRRVVAGDLEPAMIEQLHARLRAEPPPGPVVPVVADLRDLALDAQFDRIFVIREAFQLLLDDADASAALRSLGAHLTASGRLVVDLVDFEACRPSGPYPLSYFDPDLPDGTWTEDWCRTTPAGGTYRRWHRQDTRDPAIVRVDLRYALSEPGTALAGDAQDGSQQDRSGQDGSARMWLERMAFRRYSLGQFLDLASEAGLTARTVYGGYDGRVYDEGDPRCIVTLAP